MKIYDKLMRRLRKMFGKRKFKGLKVRSKVRITWYGGLVTTMEVVTSAAYVWLHKRTSIYYEPIYAYS